MDYSVIGKKIKELRKVVGLTQGELADGICTQALISRIEKGDIYPSATTLYQISKKLGVDVNYFFEIGLTPRLDYVREVERQLKKLRVKLKYDEILEIVKTEEKNPLFLKDETNLQLLYWHKGIYVNEVEKNKDEALSILERALSLTYNKKKAMSEREMNIMISMGILEFSRRNHERALEIYEDVNAALTYNDQLSDKSIKTRLVYNIARVLTRLGNYHESTRYCEEGIRWIIEEENLYGFAQLNYHIGYNLELEEKYEEALPYLVKAATLFDIQYNTTLATFIEGKIEELKAKMN
ncbi:helix-turn-helix domain-containing protein [Rossellomorea vietnamensis]|uniref:Helix-turn-helix domain-containing protein n=1 Tax=Rossellomorea vietnamensis TaxID=218284 RepID=A0A6I6UVP6_9BACI|nr:helix-turn-helix domain-containing protein [Rossellomorea vietnamensis]QHE63212.1 helix-turn-helix domain-containing protein [Rossellomorea vietnamensis]